MKAFGGGYFSPPPRQNAELQSVQASVLIENYLVVGLFFFYSWEALKIKTSKNTFLVSRKYFLAALKRLWGSVCVCKLHSVHILCCGTLWAHIRAGCSHDMGQTLLLSSLFKTNWSIHRALTDVRGRGEATATLQHLCTLLPGKCSFLYSLQLEGGVCQPLP